VKRAVPYLLLGVVALGTGLGAALGASQAPVTRSPGASLAVVECGLGHLETGINGPSFSCDHDTFTWPSKPPRGFDDCMDKTQLSEGIPNGVAAFERQVRIAISKCEAKGRASARSGAVENRHAIAKASLAWSYRPPLS
jgi:hypothetical protein